jgi:soluble lytic murein transglycosylase-like protein
MLACASLRGRDTSTEADPTAGPEPSQTSSSVSYPLPPPPTTGPAARPSPSRRGTVTPSKKPTTIALPPPPPKKPANCAPTYTGTNAPKTQVKASLDTAAARSYWGSKPEIKVPVRLAYAVAWQESGWQSAIQACDGGIGTMQIMPDTASWINQRFGTSYDVHKLDGNTSLGTQYLAWLIRYFGDVYFSAAEHPYDLGNQALLDSVIAAYNYGAAAVDPTKGDAGIPNWQYVNNVEALMTSCPCTA